MVSKILIHVPVIIKRKCCVAFLLTTELVLKRCLHIHFQISSVIFNKILFKEYVHGCKPLKRPSYKLHHLPRICCSQTSKLWYMSFTSAGTQMCLYLAVIRVSVRANPHNTDPNTWSLAISIGFLSDGHEDGGKESSICVSTWCTCTPGARTYLWLFAAHMEGISQLIWVSRYL